MAPITEQNRCHYRAASFDPCGFGALTGAIMQKSRLNETTA